MFKCIICGKEINESRGQDLAIIDHLKEFHNMNITTYYELLKLSGERDYCWKCNMERYRLVPYIDSYYLPCWGCVISGGRKSEISSANKQVLDYILDYQDSISKSKYFQYILSEDEIIDYCLPHEMNTISSIIDSLRKRDHHKILKDSLFYISHNPWNISEISERNKDNISIKIVDYIKLPVGKSDSRKLVLPGYTLELPEICDYDVRHHSRYSIINPDSKRKIKKLKLTGSKCLKLWDTRYQNIRKLIQVRDCYGNIIEDLSSLDKKDIWIIKSSILRNKEFLGEIFEIYNEICKYTECISDFVFIKNTVTLSKIGRMKYLNFTWVPDLYKNRLGNINISIL